MKNRLTKRILAAALCLTMLFTFTACDYENALALFDDTYAILPLRNMDDNPTFDEMVRSYVHYDYDAFLRYADKTEDPTLKQFFVRQLMVMGVNYENKNTTLVSEYDPGTTKAANVKDIVKAFEKAEAEQNSGRHTPRTSPRRGGPIC